MHVTGVKSQKLFFSAMGLKKLCTILHIFKETKLMKTIIISVTVTPLTAEDIFFSKLSRNDGSHLTIE